MLRRLFPILPALSLLLCVLALAAWWRGCSASDSLLLRRESLDGTGWRQREWQLDSVGGELGFCYWSCHADAPQARERGCPEGVRWERQWTRPTPAQRYAEWVGVWRTAGEQVRTWGSAGVLLARAERRGTVGGSWGGVLPDAHADMYWFAVPCWLAALLASLLPAGRAYRWARRRRRHRRDSGLCPS